MINDSNPILVKYLSLFEELLASDVYALEQSQKEALLLPVLNQLHQLHQQHCQAYQNIVDHHVGDAKKIDELPYLAVRLFKQLNLKSISDENVFKVLQSSGTTSQTPATIYLDKATSARQSKVLVKILQQTIGRQRLPMLIIDSPDILKKPEFSARAAGIQGLAFFGRDHTYALDENMQPNWPVIEAFCQKYAEQPVLIFGFTFMVWLYFIKALQNNGKTISLPNGILIHSGGWKKLIEQQVDNVTFKQTLMATTGISKCFNFYGMAEQVGSVFVECSQGHLHAPIFADVVIRDPFTLKESAMGETGLVQVLSALPSSYPGHSLLTEDLGILKGVDDCLCGAKGKYFAIKGRLPKTEVRGCSDTHSETSL
ncbi:acyl-protein synthetase [Aliiglaciecola sp. 3_MG-2023]|uniref:LuxE/PaaK family acyltransferase n=1 Tax=Aliiglaciecola sp. 3_MG-2023 TaxID=3062644 RepID=UPI0026E3F8C6|nr:acyl-protein synthetase [Aliiglaciecola sp. 3_MG-2023]MDO6691741.1 acyl-protein synthetase [Aliiglaciecola sp. 3_MG-2023]